MTKRTTLGLCLLLWSCTKPKPAHSTTISLDPPQAKLSGSVTLRVYYAPSSWSGQITVRNSAVVRVDSHNSTFQLTAPNGFNENGNTDLFVSLIDGRGLEIPLADRGRIMLLVTPSSVTLEPSADQVSGDGGSGRLRIRAADDYHWSSSNLPDWFQLTPASQGSGNSLLEYKAAANTTGQARSARIMIGDAVFVLAQPARQSSDFKPFRTVRETTKSARARTEFSSTSK